MADHRLKPITPLGHDTPHSVTLGPVTITEVVDTALASLAARMGEAKAVADIADSAGIPLPGPGKAAQGATYAAFWLSPDMWMIEAPFATHEDILAHLKPHFGETASLTEQTDAWARFDVTGDDLPAMFERLCAFDLRAQAPGAATRTVIEHLGCYIVIRASGHLSVLGPRSSAASLFHALETAARSAF
ncbi:sarcosine oxidase subunit gamma [Tabrizicola sp. TH137]|uniref:sarcosine oxidase subunit gamma n=1 Tax=Tabrizicola sp. TH137 TaxID=2067452 RepID=UPI000C7ADF41|nr:sarcosine oxidase subunit gamma [Tabrizicola sp. TH137]PLL12138.1 sarcosine oxidase subunit gamma [Tabrizicola sp. TH137]